MLQYCQILDSLITYYDSEEQRKLLIEELFTEHIEYKKYYKYYLYSISEIIQSSKSPNVLNAIKVCKFLIENGCELVPTHMYMISEHVSVLEWDLFVECLNLAIEKDHDKYIISNYMGHISKRIKRLSLENLSMLTTLKVCKLLIVKGCKLPVDYIYTMVKYISFPSAEWNIFIECLNLSNVDIGDRLISKFHKLVDNVKYSLWRDYVPALKIGVKYIQIIKVVEADILNIFVADLIYVLTELDEDNPIVYDYLKSLSGNMDAWTYCFQALI